MTVCLSVNIKLERVPFSWFTKSQFDQIANRGQSTEHRTRNRGTPLPHPTPPQSKKRILILRSKLIFSFQSKSNFGQCDMEKLEVDLLLGSILHSPNTTHVFYLCQVGRIVVKIFGA